MLLVKSLHILCKGLMTANFKQRLAVSDKIILYAIDAREKGYKTRSVYTINKHITYYIIYVMLNILIMH